MKTLKQFIKDKIPSIPSPIHFKHVYGKVSMNEEEYKGEKNIHLVMGEPDHSHHNFSSDQKKSIRYYSDSSYPINRSLIHKEGVHSHIVDHLDHLDTAIRNNRIKHDLHTYSGVDFDPEKLRNKNGHFHSPAYISSTHRIETAHNFARDGKGSRGGDVVHMIHFHLKKGDPASYIAPESNHPREGETLIARNTTMKHHGSEEYDLGKDGMQKLRVHHVSIVRNNDD